MTATAIHVYHERADRIAAEIVALDPARPVVTLADRAALDAVIEDVVVLFAPMPPRDGWAAARALRLVQLLGAGADRFLPADGLADGVEVAGLRGLFAAEVAEHAVGMLLTGYAGLPDLLARQRAHAWKQTPVRRLAGKTTCLVGLGEIGRRVARALAAMDVRVVGVSRTGRAVAGVAHVGAPGELARMAAGADALVVTAPLTPATRGIVDAHVLAALAPAAYVVNVARGELVDEPALDAALREGRLGGAALDVLTDEPLGPESPWWDAPGVTITPHVAGYAPRYVARAAERLLDNVGRLEAGAPRLGLVDRTLGY